MPARCICTKAPIFLCCPTLNGLLGLCMRSKFNSFRIMLLICLACLVQLQSMCTCDHGQNFQVSADYQVKLPQNQKSCTSSDNLRNVLGQKIELDKEAISGGGKASPWQQALCSNKSCEMSVTFV